MAYAIAIPVAVFLTVLWVGHVAIDHASVVRPGWMAVAAATILLLPLAVGVLTLPGVVAGVAATCVALVAATVETGASPRAATAGGVTTGA
jgi:hypothetical protein